MNLFNFRNDLCFKSQDQKDEKGSSLRKCKYLAEICSKPKKRNTMNQQYFVPVSDDQIYNHPEQIEGPLVPYIAGMECHEWLSIEINPDESEPLGEDTKTVKSKTSKLRLVYSAR